MIMCYFVMVVNIFEPARRSVLHLFLTEDSSVFFLLK